MEKKYELTDQTLEIRKSSGEIVTLYRIQALKDFDNVGKGDFGGYIEKEYNLSQDGDCWVYDDSMIYDYATVEGNAKVFGESSVYDNANVYGNARVYDRVTINDYSDVCENSIVCNGSYVSGSSDINKNAKVINSSIVASYITGHAIVLGESALKSVTVKDNVIIKNTNIVGPDLYIVNNAVISSISDLIIVKKWWGGGEYLIYTKSNQMWQSIYFCGTSEELLEKEKKNISSQEYNRLVKLTELVKC